MLPPEKRFWASNSSTSLPANCSTIVPAATFSLTARSEWPVTAPSWVIDPEAVSNTLPELPTTVIPAPPTDMVFESR